MKCQFLYKLEEIIRERIESKRLDSYTYQLYHSGVEKICRKIIEESSEIVIATFREGRERIIQEISDLIYHLLVLMYTVNIRINDVCGELEERHLRKTKH